MKNEIVVDGITYVKKENLNTEDYVIVRTYSAGVFAGKLEKRTLESIVNDILEEKDHV